MDQGKGKKGRKGHFLSLNEVDPSDNEDFKFSDYLAFLFGEGDEVYDKSDDPFPDSDFSMPSRNNLQRIAHMASEMPNALPLTRRNLLSQDELSFGTGPNFEQPDPIYTYLKKGSSPLAEEYLGSIKGKVRLPYAEDRIAHDILGGWLSRFSSFQRNSWSFYPIAYIQKEAHFSAVHLEVFGILRLRDQNTRLWNSYFKHLRSLKAEAAASLCQQLRIPAKYKMLFHRLLLLQVSLLWGAIPCFVPGHAADTVLLHPVVRKVWQSITDREIQIQQSSLQPSFYGFSIYGSSFSEYLSNRSPVYPSLLEYNLPVEPPVLQFTAPHYKQGIGFRLNPLRTLVCRNSAASLLCSVLTFSILNEAGLFPRKRDLPPEEKPVLFSPSPVSARFLQALSSHEKIHLRNKKDWKNAVKLYRTRKNAPSPDILWICCEQDFSHSLTLVDFLPFLRRCQVLVLCGTQLSKELQQQLHLLLLNAQAREALVTEEASFLSLLSVDCLRPFLLHCLNQFLFYRAKALEKRALINTLRNEDGTPPLKYRYKFEDDTLEIPPLQDSVFFPDIVYHTKSKVAFAAARKAALRLDTLLAPLSDFCTYQLRCSRSFSKMKPWKELLLCGTLWDMILKDFQGYTLPLPPRLPDAGWVYFEILHAVPSSPPAVAPAPAQLNLLSAFYAFVREQPLCDSLDSYLAASSRLGWKDSSTVYLDYERFWPAFMKYAGLDAAWESKRNRFLRENFRPGEPGGSFAYATDSKDGHWGHRIRKNKRAKPLGKFLRLRIEILQA